MNLDEFSFFNQQLAAMLREGIPLEGALRKLAAEMTDGRLRNEVDALELDLARGLSLPEALQARQLPDLYRRMVSVGAQAQDLPGVLTLLADHYRAEHLQMTRLKGLLTYPVLVLAAVFALSLGFHFFMRRIFAETWADAIFDMMPGDNLPRATALSLPLIMHSWVFPLGFGLLLAAVLLVLTIPALRDRLRWHLPAFREASLAKIAGTMALLLDKAVPLPEAVDLVQQLETRSRAGQELKQWKMRLAQGITRFPDVAADTRVFPPLFVWLAHNAGANLAQGFRRAGEIYRARAAARAEVLLHAALPVAVLVLGALIVTQAVLMLSSFLVFVSLLDSLGG